MYQFPRRRARACSTSRSFVTRAMRFEWLEAKQMMAADFQTTATAYMVPTAPAVEITPLITVGDSVDGYRMVGIPDGLGALDNRDGTFTVLMNHELANNVGAPRDHHGADPSGKGSFVSRWVIDKRTLQVLEGDDLIKTLNVWDSTTGQYVVGAGAISYLNRLCSADLPEPAAFFNPVTGRGTDARIFMNGEETSNGRTFAQVATGTNAGTSWELPWMGKFAWENNVASPFAQDKTVVIGLDDSRREFSSEGATEPSEVYVWIGNKQRTGSDIEKAGLRHGILHGLRVGVPGNYDANEGSVVSGERFELVPLSDQTNNATFAPLQAESIAKSITQFRRVEDGHFDPTNPDIFYFVTTDQFGGNTRLWKLTFDDIRNPEAGGVIEIAIDSPAGVDGEMFDNITTNWAGDVLLQEDPGGQPYLAKIWQYDASTADLTEIAQHNPALFGAAGIDLYPDIPGVQGTQDEESSGIIDLSQILGEGYYLADVQAHYRFTATTDPTGELVEAGQLLVINTSAATAELTDGVLKVQGTVNSDDIRVLEDDGELVVRVNGKTIAEFDFDDGDNNRRRGERVHSILIHGAAGSDQITIDRDIKLRAAVLGGAGNDRLTAGGGRTVLIGGEGGDLLTGNSDSDLLIGGTTAHDASDSALLQILAAWDANRSYRTRIESLGALLNDATVFDDADRDELYGKGDSDWFWAEFVDITDARSNERVS
jgi:hypothetical protein